MTAAWQRFDLPSVVAPNGLTDNNNTSGTGGGTLATNGLNETYGYDSFGNMLSAGNFNFMQSYTTANQLSGWNYDASGNLLTDSFNNVYTYDAESRIATEVPSSGGSHAYVYDADGNRVEKGGTGGTDYIYFGGRQLARLSGGQWTDLIYGVGGLIAEVPGTQTGAPVYRMVDHLGTVVGTLNSSGTLLSTLDYAPFGHIFAGGTADPYVFTGKERDTESGLDYFGARYYASNMGRWMSPDWSAQASPVPYATMGDPQSLNLYSYVGNNPLSRADADDHFGDYYLANAVGTKDAKYVGSDGINDGAVHVLAPGSTVTYSPDHSIIDLSQTSAPVADFSRAEGVAMHDAVSRSNAPNATDTTGGAHEEGFATTNGVITAAPAGPTFKPGDDHASITVPTTADTSLKVHVHPEGNGSAAFNQQPSTVDKNNVDPLSRPNMTSVVVGAGSGKVQTYNGQGVTATVPLKDFPKQ